MGEENVMISSIKAADDWIQLSKNLKDETNKISWESIYDDYFMERLNSRYFQSIKLLLDFDSCTGEGFSMMTILCSLIEFLESTIQGKNYRFVRNEKDLEEFEYSKSVKIFTDFLTKRKPFLDVFTGEKQAIDFYVNVRCGLLHEAQTKNSWIIKGKNKENDAFVDLENKIVFRNNFYEAIKTFANDYKNDLLSKKEYQEAFIRKYDYLCKNI